MARLMAVTIPHPIVRFTDVHLEMASDAGMVNILRGITLDIAAGEIAAIVGPSGAGKSSLMMVAGGLERATSGKVEVVGRDLGPLDDDASFHVEDVPKSRALEIVPVFDAEEIEVLDGSACDFIGIVNRERRRRRFVTAESLDEKRRELGFAGAHRAFE